MPDAAAIRQVPVTVSRFLEAGRGRLAIEPVSGTEGLNRPITEAAVNRVGLALTDFFRYFAQHRVQIIGHAENAYLTSLADQTRTQRVRAVLKKGIPCLVFTRNRRVAPAVARLGDEFGVPILRSRLITKHFINAATIVLENLMAPRITMQGTMVDIMGVGVLLEGNPGVGKSETALALVKKGFSLVADDVTKLIKDSAGKIVGSPVGVTRYHMEIRGVGIIHVPSLYGIASVRAEKELELIIGFKRLEHNDDRRWEIDGGYRMRNVLGVNIPSMVLPVAPGREMANIVEAAALDFKLKQLGHDAAKELDLKLMDVMHGRTNGT